MNERRDFDTYVVKLAEDLRDSAIIFSASGKMSELDNNGLPKKLKPLEKTECHSRVKRRSISVITGVQTNALPPAKNLTNDQVTYLYDGMALLLSARSFCVNLPPKLPVKQKYSLLRDKWDDKYEFPADTRIYLEFCDCDPASCPFPHKCCSCKDFNGFVDYFDDTTIIF
jgi:hypothetical protein